MVCLFILQLSLPGKPLPLNLRVEVESSKGDADLFLSQTVAAPSQCRYTWCNQEVERSIIQLNSEDEKNYDITKVQLRMIQWEPMGATVLHSVLLFCLPILWVP